MDRANEVYEHLRNGNCITDVPQLNTTNDQLDFELAERMDELMGSFMEWDFENDTLGFLQIAKEALNPE